MESWRKFTWFVIGALVLMFVVLGTWWVVSPSTVGTIVPAPTNPIIVDNAWKQTIGRVIDPGIYDKLPASATTADVPGSDTQAGVYPIYTFSGSATVDQELFDSSAPVRAAAVISVNQVIESLFLPGKPTYIDHFPTDAKTMAAQVPTEAQKAKFTAVVIKSRLVSFDVASDGSIHTDISLAGSLSYKGVPMEFQFVCQMDSSNGTLTGITAVGDNAFVLIGSDGSYLINEMK